MTTRNPEPEAARLAAADILGGPQSWHRERVRRAKIAATDELLLRPAIAGMRKLKGSRVLRPVFVCALVALFGFLAYKAGQQGLSDEYRRWAVPDIINLTEPGPRTVVEKWLRAKQNLTDSLRHAPLNPKSLLDAGRHEIRKLVYRIPVTPFNIDLRGAYRDFRMALTQLPTSADAWANLALTKLYLGEWGDEEMVAALRYADQAAPWEFEVQQVILFVSLNVWSKLDADQRAATARTVERATRRNADKVARLLQGFKRLDLMCDTGNGDPKVQELCSQLRKPPATQKPRQRQRKPPRNPS